MRSEPAGDCVRIKQGPRRHQTAVRLSQGVEVELIKPAFGHLKGFASGRALRRPSIIGRDDQAVATTVDRHIFRADDGRARALVDQRDAAA